MPNNQHQYHAAGHLPPSSIVSDRHTYQKEALQGTNWTGQTGCCVVLQFPLFCCESLHLPNSQDLGGGLEFGSLRNFWFVPFFTPWAQTHIHTYTQEIERYMYISIHTYNAMYIHIIKHICIRIHTQKQWRAHTRHKHACMMVDIGSELVRSLELVFPCLPGHNDKQFFLGSCSDMVVSKVD